MTPVSSQCIHYAVVRWELLKKFREVMSRFNPYLLITICISATCGLLFGFDTAIIAGASPFIEKEFSASIGQIEWIVSACALGALFGAISSGRATDILGRRKVLVITGCIFVAGTLLAAYAQSVAALIAGRFILGFAVGTGRLCSSLRWLPLSHGGNSCYGTARSLLEDR